MDNDSRDDAARDRVVIPTVAIVGHKNSGKTTLVVKLIEAFTHFGLRVASIKHTSDEVGFDKPHSDSDRHKHAGAIAVGMVARSELGFYLEHTEEISEAWMELTFRRLPHPPDLIIYEGYRGGPHPKIECIRNADVSAPSFTAADGLIAVVSDHPISADTPVYPFDPLEPICEIIRSSFKRSDWPRTERKLH